MKKEKDFKKTTLCQREHPGTAVEMGLLELKC